VRQELLDFSGAHRPRMALVVKQNETPRPIDVALLGPSRVMTHPQDESQLIEQPRRPRLRQFPQANAQNPVV
jgi:hypothetical protein